MLLCSNELVRDRIIEAVAEKGGVKETDLAIEIINDLTEHPAGNDLSAATVLHQIQRAIREGRIVGIDCQTGERGCTYLFPAGTQIRTVVPVMDTRTRH